MSLPRPKSWWYADRVWWARFHCSISGHRIYGWEIPGQAAGRACARCGRVWTAHREGS